MFIELGECLIEVDVVLDASEDPGFFINTAVSDVDNGGKIAMFPKRKVPLGNT